MELLAPNGEYSNLSPENYELVRTPEFKAWFGDWEIDPENASKVVDENGEPLVVYRGLQTATDYARSGLQYFAYDYDYARMWSKDRGGIGNVIEVFLSIKNPLNFEEYNKQLFDYGIDAGWRNKKEGLLQISDDLEKKKPYIAQLGLMDSMGAGDLVDNFMEDLKTCDGFFGYDAGYYGEQFVFVTKEPNQIKLADGSNTTFNSNNPDIRFMGGGSVLNYLRNIRLDDNYHKGHPEDYPEIQQYRAEFGRNGSITFRVYPNKNGILSNSIYVASIDRDILKKYGETQSIEGKKDSRGEGTMAIASLFLTYPLVKSLHYEDESYFENEDKSFWKKIGGGVDELFRADFFKYFENKFGNNPDIRYEDGGNINYYEYTIGGL